jgi:hypothetical protein
MDKFIDGSKLDGTLNFHISIGFKLSTFTIFTFVCLHSFTFSANMLGEKMERNIMIYSNDKINLKNKINISEGRIFEFRESKSISINFSHFF